MNSTFTPNYRPAKQDKIVKFIGGDLLRVMIPYERHLWSRVGTNFPLLQLQSVFHVDICTIRDVLFDRKFDLRGSDRSTV